MASHEVLIQRAAEFLAMHRPGDPVILPTVWDVWSARLAVDAGFRALTVGSNPVAQSIGKSDGEGMTLRDLLGRVRQITAAVDVPVSVDLESGYAETPVRLIEGLLESGGVGLNIEDTVHSQDKRLRSVADHAEFIGQLREAAEVAGNHVVINARTDLFLRADGDDTDRIDRVIARLNACAEAGADVVYPVGRLDAATLSALTAGLSKPVNALSAPDHDDPATFARAGVARVSFGGLFQAALGRRAGEILQAWS